MRVLKSDHAATVGMHCFEVAGLGTAPFRFIQMSISKHSDSPGCPVRPGSSCDYCSTSIMYVCHILDSTGKGFKVGTDCVARTGDSGLIQAYKTSPVYRAHQKALRDAKDDANKAELERLLNDTAIRTRLEASTFTSHYAWGEARQDNHLASAERSLPWCGAKGRADWLRTLKKILA